MAPDPRSDSDTEDVPTALSAFEAQGADREDDAGASSRAAALLSLIRSKRLSMPAFRAATAEARELTGMEPVEPPEGARDRLREHWSALGPTGQRAVELLAGFEARRTAELGGKGRADE